MDFKTMHQRKITHQMVIPTKKSIEFRYTSCQEKSSSYQRLSENEIKSTQKKQTYRFQFSLSYFLFFSETQRYAVYNRLACIFSQNI